MAQISITVPDALVPRIQSAFALSYEYKAQIPDPQNPGQTIPNPENMAAFLRRILKEFMRDVVIEQEAGAAQATARQNAYTQITADFG